MREKDLEGHFTQEEAKPESSTRSGVSVEADLQLARALEVLKSWTYFERLRNAPTSVQASVVEDAPTAIPHEATP